MHMQIFRVKNSSFENLKTKNCVPFEVQYYSSLLRAIGHSTEKKSKLFCWAANNKYPKQGVKVHSKPESDV